MMPSNKRHLKDLYVNPTEYLRSIQRERVRTRKILAEIHEIRSLLLDIEEEFGLKEDDSNKVSEEKSIIEPPKPVKIPSAKSSRHFDGNKPEPPRKILKRAI